MRARAERPEPSDQWKRELVKAQEDKARVFVRLREAGLREKALEAALRGLVATATHALNSYDDAGVDGYGIGQSTCLDLERALVAARRVLEAGR